jgi:hypothetical protein
MRVAANLDGEHSQDEPQRLLLPAVVPSDSRENTAAAATNRTSAALLAQLVATVENMPSSRARRRIDPRVGANLYRSVAKLTTAPRRPKDRNF